MAWPDGVDVYGVALKCFQIESRDGDKWDRVTFQHYAISGDEFVKSGEPVDLPAGGVLVKKLEGGDEDAQGNVAPSLMDKLVSVRYLGKRTSERSREYHNFAVSEIPEL